MSKKPDLKAMAQEIEAHLRAVREALRQPILNDIVRSGLTGPQISLLQVLLAGDGKSLKELRQALGLAHSTVSGIVDRLEKHGAVVRRPDAQDGRILRVFLMPAIQDYVHQMPNIRVHPLMRALDELKPAQRQTVLEGLRLLRGVVDKE